MLKPPRASAAVLTLPVVNRRKLKQTPAQLQSQEKQWHDDQAVAGAVVKRRPNHHGQFPETVDQAADEQCAPRTQAEQRAAGGNRASRSLHQAAYQRHDGNGCDQISIGRCCEIALKTGTADLGVSSAAFDL